MEDAVRVTQIEIPGVLVFEPTVLSDHRGAFLEVYQGKLVMALEGTVYDVVVDIRKGSPSFGRWYGVELSGDNLRQMYIPPGCAHGFCVTSATASFLYKCTAYYSPECDRGILWNDPALRIQWPISEPILSSKDQRLPTLSAMDSELPVYRSPA